MNPIAIIIIPAFIAGIAWLWMEAKNAPSSDHSVIVIRDQGSVTFIDPMWWTA